MDEKILTLFSEKKEDQLLTLKEATLLINLPLVTWFPETWTNQKKLVRLLEDTAEIPFWIHRDKPKLHRKIRCHT
jgi:hypothetical protein